MTETGDERLRTEDIAEREIYTFLRRHRPGKMLVGLSGRG